MTLANSNLVEGVCFVDPVSGVVGRNQDSTVATLAAAVASAISADQVNANGRGVQISINVTGITGTTPTLTVVLQGKDPASGAYYTLLTSAAISAAGFTQLTLYPGLVAAANVAANSVLPRTWRISYTIGGTTPSVTATIGASVIQ